MSAYTRVALLATSALCIGLSVGSSAFAQEASSTDDIVVTARRVEERLQDVPISITVLNQQQLQDRNITSAFDLGRYVPSLSASERFGADGVSFSIRGFTQEQRTPASVGVFFADVVAPRGNATVQSGDGSGPGYIWDLQNVQVLKGPQGTLFGRNTTGGDILLVPQRPDSEFSGYVEGLAGNFDLRGGQAVVNLPLNNAVRLRLGVNHQEREGYLDNVSGIGPDHFNGSNYTAYRASVVADLLPNLENYTIVNYVDSDHSGSLSQVYACDLAPGVGLPSLGQFACNSNMTPPTAVNGHPVRLHAGGFYDVQNVMPNPQARLQQWTVANTTTWDVSDNLTIKNILGYSELETLYRSPVFGNNFEPVFGIPLALTASDAPFGLGTTAQSTLSEELQFQGRFADGRVTWQAGLYYEQSEPTETTGNQAANLLACAPFTSTDPSSFSCNDPTFGNAALTSSRGEIAFENRAVYAQGTFAATAQLNLTAGVRYTWDETSAWQEAQYYGLFPNTLLPAGPPGTPALCSNPLLSPLNNCHEEFSQESEAPTYMIGAEYSASDDVMLYAKYSRGYRQGGINTAAPPGLAVFEPEEVDAYEIGAKTSFDGPVRGNFNISVFYNELAGQQLQAGFFPTSPGFSPSTVIVNAEETTIAGVEISSTLNLTDNLTASVDYAYLNTELESVGATPVSLYGIVAAPEAGTENVYAPRNKVSVSLSYRLPVPETLGDVTIGATYTYTDTQFAAPCLTAANIAGSPFCEVQDYGLLDLNLNWNSIAATPVDFSVFATNVTNEEYIAGFAGTFATGFEAAYIGVPRMIGARVRYRFGS